METNAKIKARDSGGASLRMDADTAVAMRPLALTSGDGNERIFCVRAREKREQDCEAAEEDHAAN
jgi:hypothetical protein